MRNPCLTAALDELVKVGIQHLEIANGGKHCRSAGLQQAGSAWPRSSADSGCNAHTM